MRLFAHVPADYRKGGIEWLVLEDDPDDTGGFFLYLHRSLEEPCEYDGWFERIEQAKKEAEREWGVREDSWAEAK